jgi:cysteine-rich repeat protein
MRVRCLLALCLLLGACFEPSYPVGLPCSEGRTCPPGQTCDVDSICRIEPLPPPSQPECGNGLVDTGEACDDGNNISGDGCSANCLSTEVCGNGFLDVAVGEGCDDGNAVNEDLCTAACALASCSDSFDNADEIDVDCGGHCGPGSCDLEQICGGDPDCDSGFCSESRCAVRLRLVFVTSELFDGNLGGLAGADAHCQRLASDAGLPGAYRAWLSDGRDSPSTRFTRSTGPYVLVNGTVIADSYADFTDGTLDNPIVRTERDADPPESTGNDCNKANSPTAVWSGSAANGGGIPVNAGQRCQDWTSAEGNGQMGDAARFDTPDWSTACSSACTARAPLYCMQQ